MGFADELIRRLNDQFGPAKQIDDGIPGKLYHYTTAEGVLGIISGGTVRLTDIRYLNDSSELRYGADIAISVIEAFYQKKNNKVINEFLSQAIETISPDIVDWYVFCLCEQPNLLSQWRAYGGTSTPYCLGLTTDSKLWSSYSLAILRCIYDEDEMRRRVTDRIGLICDYLSEKTHSDSENVEQYIAEACQAVRTSVGIDFIRYKHKSFAEEQEWRFVFGLSKELEVPREFRAGKYGITPYISALVELWQPSISTSGPGLKRG